MTAVPLNFGDLDLFEVQVLNDEQGPRVVAAVELVSPANKDRPGHRRMFAVKCASYLQQNVGLVVDAVTERSFNLHAELLQLLGVTATTPAQAPGDLYAVAYRTIAEGPNSTLEVWGEALALAAPLPTVPLWIGADQCISLNLE